MIIGRISSIIQRMVADQEPQGYQYRHREKIILDGYSGIGADVMQLNEPIADGFMRVADMRKSIVVVRKQEERVVDYDQLGTVRVGKIVSLPRMGRRQKTDVMSTHWGVDNWTIEIDDQKLLRKVVGTDSKEGKKLEERFVDAFRDQVRQGTVDFLSTEKLVNGGVYSAAIPAAYCSFLALYGFDALVLGELLPQGKMTADLALNMLGLDLFGNILVNTGMKIGPKLLPDAGDRKSTRNRSKPLDDEPFIRTWRDGFMPTWPVDRLVRGLAYDAMHGSKIITHIGG